MRLPTVGCSRKGESHRAMPRHPRLEIPGVPLHVTQRGVNRCAIFLGNGDRQVFLDYLACECSERQVRIHAYVLMDNHVHLLVAAEHAGRISRAMAVCSQRYVRYFNFRYARTGTLFQSRFKSCLVDSESYLMRVIRYIELNPVRAALAEQAKDYAWSSARAHLGLRHDPLVSLHPAYEQLAATPAERVRAYAGWLAQAVDADEQASIRHYLSQERALGSERFQAMVEKTLGFPATVIASGQKRSALLTRV